MVLLVLQTFALFHTLSILEYVEALDLHRHSERIIQGADADIEDFPSYAGLVGCGASIISESWVVTASHCLLSAPLFINYVWVGGSSFSSSQIVSFDDVEFYDSKDETVFDILAPVDDIVLLHLSEPLKFSDTIQPVELPSFEDLTRSGEDSMLKFASRGYNENLETMDVCRLSTEDCMNYMPRYIQEVIQPFVSSLEKAIICAKRVDGRAGLCQGDSGSPLMDGNTLIGIASFTRAPCEDAELGFYVNVANYVPWIKSVTGLE